MTLWSEHDDILFVSPHFDDAVFSCAGLGLASAALPRRCLTIFGGGGLPEGELGHVARMILRSMGGQSLADTMEARAKEDEAAARCVGWTSETLRWSEAPFRCAMYGATPLSLFRTVVPEEDALIERIANEVLARTSERTLVVAPLGVGHHVDHVLAMRAAQRVARAGRCVLFYEDYPYADASRPMPLVRLARLARLGEAVAPERVWAALSDDAPCIPEPIDFVAEHLDELGLRGRHELGPAFDIRAKTDAVLAYTSQVSSLFGDQTVEVLLGRFHTRAELGSNVPRERYWLLDT